MPPRVTLVMWATALLLALLDGTLACAACIILRSSGLCGSERILTMKPSWPPSSAATVPTTASIARCSSSLEESEEIVCCREAVEISEARGPRR
jgi:hypothetical protein